MMFPTTGTAPAVPWLVQAGNTAAITPAAALATSVNQGGLAFDGWSSGLNYFRNTNALNAVMHTTVGAGFPLGLMPANLHLYNMFHQQSDLWAMNQIYVQQFFAGTVARTALLGEAGIADVLLSPLSTAFV